LTPDYMKRMQAFFDKELAASNKTEAKCTAAKTAVVGPKADCGTKKKTYEDEKNKCDVTLPGEVKANCAAWSSALKNMCATYGSCYKAAQQSYKDLVNTTEKRIVELKLEWRMLQRLTCLVGAFDQKGNKVSKKKLDSCIKKAKYDTSHLNLTYEDAPAQASCDSSLPDGVSADDCVATTSTATTTTTSAKPSYEWSACTNLDISKINVCRVGWTQMGSAEIFPDSFQSDTQGCKYPGGVTGTKVKCVDAKNPSSYLSGLCTTKAHLHTQCSGGILAKAISSGSCGTGNTKFQATCKEVSAAEARKASKSKAAASAAQVAVAKKAAQESEDMMVRAGLEEERR